MINKELEQELKSIEGLEIHLAIDLTSYTSLKLVSTGDLLIVRSLSALQKTVALLTREGISYKSLGLGRNTVIPEQATHPYIKLDFPTPKEEFETLKNEYKVSASVTLGTLTQCAIRFGLKGWEVFTGIPASLGGALFMNAGTNLGEIGSLVKLIRLVTKEGEVKEILPTKGTFSYRKNHFLNDGDIIFEAILTHGGADQEIPLVIQNYLKKRSASQPLTKNTCGCTFKNRKTSPPCLAGQTLDIMGLKGLTYKNISLSRLHANFFEHQGGATRSDLLGLAKIINDELALQMGITLEFEVRV